MKRKEFLIHAAKAGLVITAGSIPADLLAKSGLTKLTILHTNDQHSRIEPFPMDGSKYQGMGGFAQRAAYIRTVRAAEKNVLLLDSGDIWQGTPYFNKYGGSLEFQLMSEMQYDAVTLGNHDFDAGIEGLVKHLPQASFPFLCSNYRFEDTPLHRKIGEYKVFNYNGVKVGVFGLGIELKGLVPDSLCRGVRYEDPIQHAQRVANRLKNDYKCAYVICLSHLGYQYKEDKVSDLHLAAKTSNVDLILGGHTHTFMQQPDEVINKDGKKVLVNQVGWAGIWVGRVDVYFSRGKNNLVLPDMPKMVSSGV